MKMLAYVVITVTAPDMFAGQVLESIQPQPCIEFSERIMALAEANGGAVDTLCRYTNAPANSSRPTPRPLST